MDTGVYQVIGQAWKSQCKPKKIQYQYFLNSCYKNDDDAGYPATLNEKVGPKLQCLVVRFIVVIQNITGLTNNRDQGA